MKNQISIDQNNLNKAFLAALIKLGRDSKKIAENSVIPLDSENLVIVLPTETGKDVIMYDLHDYVTVDGDNGDNGDNGVSTNDSWLRLEFVTGVDDPIETQPFNLTVSEMVKYVMSFPPEVVKKSINDFEILREQMLSEI